MSKAEFVPHPADAIAGHPFGLHQALTLGLDGANLECCSDNLSRGSVGQDAPEASLEARPPSRHSVDSSRSAPYEKRVEDASLQSSDFEGYKQTFSEYDGTLLQWYIDTHCDDGTAPRPEFSEDRFSNIVQSPSRSGSTGGQQQWELATARLNSTLPTSGLSELLPRDEDLTGGTIGSTSNQPMKFRRFARDEDLVNWRPTGHSSSQYDHYDASDLRNSGSAGSSAGSASSYASMGSRRGRKSYGHPKNSQSATQSGKHVCSKCGKNFKTMFTLRRHRESVHEIVASCTCGPIVANERPRCPVCLRDPSTCHHLMLQCWTKSVADRTFYRKDALTQHLRRVHHYGSEPWVKDFVFDCLVNSNSPHNSHLIFYKIRHHCDRSMALTREPCGAIFSDFFELLRHIYIFHAAIRSTGPCRSCSEDGKMFSSEGALLLHTQVAHPGPGPSSKLRSSQALVHPLWRHRGCRQCPAQGPKVQSPKMRQNGRSGSIDMGDLSATEELDANDQLGAWNEWGAAI